MPAQTVLLAGATGLVGSHALRYLLADPEVSRVTALVRRPIPNPPPDPEGKLHQAIIDFDRIDTHAWAHPETFRADHVLCALGTTIREAGSREAFKRVDRNYPFKLARIGLGLGAKHYALVSAAGASAASPVFYNRVKGQTEDSITALSYPAVTILRPTLLLGERDEFRLGEEAFKRLDTFLPPPVRGIEAEVVGRVLAASIHLDHAGVRLIPTDGMRR